MGFGGFSAVGPIRLTVKTAYADVDADADLL